MTGIRLEISDVTVDVNDDISLKYRMYLADPGVGWTLTTEGDVDFTDDIASELVSVFDSFAPANITPAP